jgi:cytochrome c peroxidase
MMNILGKWPQAIISAMLWTSLAGCGSKSSPEPLSPEAALGKLIYFDASLSASGSQSCASCHQPAFGHAQPNDLAAQPGGNQMQEQGQRTSPSLRYLAYNTPFEVDAEGKAKGGFFWDGRAQTLAEQAKQPFLGKVEMANPDVASVIEKLAATPYAAQFQKVFGANILSQPDAAFEHMAMALQKFQLEDPSFRPFSSRFDQYLAGKIKLSTAEMRGMDLFKNAEKGNCAACHTAEKNQAGLPPLFTDFSYDNLGIPRNLALKHNQDPAYFDLGLCAKTPEDKQSQSDWCGAFKVPSLRNAAVRQAFFHNGQFKSLREVLVFYVQRDTHPEKWYPRLADGRIDKFNDLPAAYKNNVNVEEVPYERMKGQTPALNEAEIEDVLAFLRTLTDADLKPSQ